MSHYDSDSPVTSESQTQLPSPCIPSRLGGNASGSAPIPGMSTMMQQPQMRGMMPGYYNMPGMMPGYYNMSGMMMPQMQQMPGMMPQMQQTPGMLPQMQQTPGMMPQMQPGRMMPQLQQGSTAAAGGSRQAVPQPHEDNVYRPYMDLLYSDFPQRTTLETQFAGIEMFSYEELGIAPRMKSATQPAAPAVRTRRQGKGKVTSSRAATDGGAKDEEGEGGSKRMTVWNIQECVVLAKEWISVVDDPYVSSNQVIDRMWYCISQSYLKWKPANGKAHGAEQCRKQWERLKKQLNRFVSIYQKNMRSATSGMTSEDVKLLSHQ